MRWRLIIFFILASIFLAGCLPASLTINYAEDQIHQAPTVDGLHVGLIHLPPKGTPKDSTPLILCHGFTSTSISYDLGNGHGMGPYLSEAGYDVWMLNLRGRRFSSKPNLGKGHIDYDWTFDDYLNYDLPAAIKYVTEQTGAKQVTWIGHSMGGMLMYAYLGSPKHKWRNNVEKIIIIASPTNFAPIDDSTNALAKIGKVFINSGDMLPIQSGAKLTGRYLAKRRDMAQWTINPDNFSEQTTLYYLANGTPNVSGGAINQFLGWLNTNTFTSLDGEIDYRAGVEKIEVPALVMAGKLDNLAPIWAVYPGYKLLSSKDKTFYLLGQVNGCKEDHAHGGVILGNWAKEEVYAVVKDWLDQRL